MRVLILALVLVALVGCGFSQGFRDEGARQLADMTAQVVNDKLGAEFDGVGAAIKEIPAKIPSTPAGEQGALYGLGALVAYIVGSVGKGAYRKYAGK